MGDLVIRTGIIGLSEGNGHPFSFSAIVNGYDDRAFAAAGWPVIHNYLKAQGPERFGIPGVRVTQRVDAGCAADEHAVRRLQDRNGMRHATGDDRHVDAVIVARDDWETHARLAMPFLEAGLFVFVDKPLSLDDGELARFEPYLRSGKLMSCSGLRFARELDEFRSPRAQWDDRDTEVD